MASGVSGRLAAIRASRKAREASDAGDDSSVVSGDSFFAIFEGSDAAPADAPVSDDENPRPTDAATDAATTLSTANSAPGRATPAPRTRRRFGSTRIISVAEPALPEPARSETVPAEPALAESAPPDPEPAPPEPAPSEPVPPARSASPEESSGPVIESDGAVDPHVREPADSDVEAATDPAPDSEPDSGDAAAADAPEPDLASDTDVASEAPARPEVDTRPEVHTQPEVGTRPDFETGSEVDTQPDPELLPTAAAEPTAGAAGAKAQPRAVVRTGGSRRQRARRQRTAVQKERVEPKAEARAQQNEPAGAPEPDVHPEAELGPGPETGDVAHDVVPAQPEAAAPAEPENDPVAEAEPTVQPEAGFADGVTLVSAEDEIQYEPETEPTEPSEAGAQPDAGLEGEAEPEAGLAGEAEPEAGLAGEAEPEAELAGEAEPEAEPAGPGASGSDVEAPAHETWDEARPAAESAAESEAATPAENSTSTDVAPVPESGAEPPAEPAEPGDQPAEPQVEPAVAGALVAAPALEHETDSEPAPATNDGAETVAPGEAGPPVTVVSESPPEANTKSRGAAPTASTAPARSELQSGGEPPQQTRRSTTVLAGVAAVAVVLALVIALAVYFGGSSKHQADSGKSLAAGNSGAGSAANSASGSSASGSSTSSGSTSQSATPTGTAVPPALAARTALGKWAKANLSKRAEIVADSESGAVLRREGFTDVVSDKSTTTAWQQVAFLIRNRNIGHPSAFRTTLAAASAPLALFGTGKNEITVSQVYPALGSGLPAALARDASQRKQAGAELLQNQNIRFSPTAKTKIRAGGLDIRADALLVTLARTTPVYVIDLPSQPAEVRAGRPYRAIVISTSDLGMVQQTVSGVGLPYRPTKVSQIDQNAIELQWIPALVPVAGG